VFRLRSLTRVGALSLACCASLVLTGCNRQLLSFFFDFPEPAPAPVQAGESAGQESLPFGFSLEEFFASRDTVRPAIENVMEPDSVVVLLPRDHAGNIDWVRALSDSLIRPRDGFATGGNLVVASDFRFGFDFYYRGPDATFDAYFPHSVHTESVECAQCHARIFPYRGVEIKMADIYQGEFCGECHGTVAFPVLTGCERCHQALELPPDRATPELLGTVQMRRASDILAELETQNPVSVVGAEIGTDSATAAPSSPSSFLMGGGLSEAQFPHWVHRIRYTCKTCHMEIFEPRAGSNAITMAQIRAGEKCGRCHDGTTAFDPGFGACERCHIPQAEEPLGSFRR